MSKKVKVPWGLQKMMLQAIREEHQSRQAASEKAKFAPELMAQDLSANDPEAATEALKAQHALFGLLKTLPYFWKEQQQGGIIMLYVDVKDVQRALEVLNPVSKLS